MKEQTFSGDFQTKIDCLKMRAIADVRKSRFGYYEMRLCFMNDDADMGAVIGAKVNSLTRAGLAVKPVESDRCMFPYSWVIAGPVSALRQAALLMAERWEIGIYYSEALADGSKAEIFIETTATFSDVFTTFPRSI